MRRLTHQALIALHNSDKIELTSEIRVIEPLNYESAKPDFKPMLRSAHYLGVLFHELNEVDIYKLFKIVP